MKIQITILLIYCSLLEVSAQSGVVKYWSINENMNYKKEFTLSFNKNESLLVYDLKPFTYTTEEGYKVSSSGQYSAVYLNTSAKQGTIYRKKKGETYVRDYWQTSKERMDNS